jgi:hypothetical protein
MSASPGRSCPLDYRYRPADIATAPALQAEHAYVIGGLYGNVEALQAIEAMRDREAAQGRAVTLVFNGDAHWFDVAASDFARIAAALETHAACSGNVEAELARGPAGAGCGCAYPEFVDQAVVDRSNRIIERLHFTAQGLASHVDRLGRLAKHLRLRIGAVDIGVVHGDAWSLAGWSFSQEALRDAQQADWPDGPGSLRAAWAESGARILCSSHSCLPAAVELALDDGPRVLMNNGAAGMPNFRGGRFGVITRISSSPQVPPDSLYGTMLEGLRIDAMPVRYDHAAWCARFVRNWPPGSDAHVSYWERIERGPDYLAADALFGGFAGRRGNAFTPVAREAARCS